MKTMEKMPTNAIRETLFGDMPISSWPSTAHSAEPWANFAQAREQMEQGNEQEAASILLEIIKMPGLESRHYLQAQHFIRQLGFRLKAETELLGVVIEVALPEGLDLLAAYRDGTARYYNYSGAGVVWE